MCVYSASKRAHVFPPLNAFLACTRPPLHLCTHSLRICLTLFRARFLTSLSLSFTHPLSQLRSEVYNLPLPTRPSDPDSDFGESNRDSDDMADNERDEVQEEHDREKRVLKQTGQKQQQEQQAQPQQYQQDVYDTDDGLELFMEYRQRSMKQRGLNSDELLHAVDLLTDGDVSASFFFFSLFHYLFHSTLSPSPSASCFSVAACQWEFCHFLPLLLYALFAVAVVVQEEACGTGG